MSLLLSAQGILAGLALGLTLCAAYTDTFAGRVPNKLTYSGIVAGVVAGAVFEEITVASRLWGIAVGFALLFLFWRYGTIGGGDVKLTMMIGALKGATFCLYFLLYTLGFAVIAIVFIAVLRSGLIATLRYFLSSLFGVFLLRRMPATPPELEKLHVPFAAFGFLSVLVCSILEWRGLLEPTLPFG